MINANAKQQQKVDNEKATNANFNRKTQINLTQYSSSSNRNILSENNYYLPKDYHHTSIDLSGNQLALVSKTITTPTSNATIDSTATSLSIATGLLNSDTTNSTNLLNEQISALFPKCRPKIDANLNKTSLYIDTNSVSATKLTSASILLASSPSNGDFQNQNKFIADCESLGNTLIDNSRAYTRNMNNQNTDATMNGSIDDRIQNNATVIGDATTNNLRMNHTNYRSQNSNSNYQRSSITKIQQSHQNNDYHSISDLNQSTKYQKWDGTVNDMRKWPDNDDFLRETNVWEKRRRSPNITSTNNVLNSPDFNDVHHYTHHPVQHQIKVGRSPVNQHEHNKEKSHQSSASPIQMTHRSNKRPATLISDGEIVVFDDIDNWRNQNEKTAQIKQLLNQSNKQHTNHRFNHMIFDDDDDYIDKDDQHDTNSFSTENVTKMIGELRVIIGLF